EANVELRLGTRGSQLAMWQANTVAARIAAAGGPPCRIVIIKTSGDRLQEAPISDVGGKRLFVKEIEDALFRREIDLAVHSSKDMPAVLPEGLVIAAVLPREDPLDALVLPVRAQGSEPRAQGSGLRAQKTAQPSALSPPPLTLDAPAASAALAAERALVETLGGGCQTPIGALATPVDGDMIELVAAVVALDGSRAVRERARGSRSEARALGAHVARQLLSGGAGEILAEARHGLGAVEGIQP